MIRLPDIPIRGVTQNYKIKYIEKLAFQYCLAARIRKEERIQAAGSQNLSPSKIEKHVLYYDVVHSRLCMSQRWLHRRSLRFRIGRSGRPCTLLSTIRTITVYHIKNDFSLCPLRAPRAYQRFRRSSISSRCVSNSLRDPRFSLLAQRTKMSAVPLRLSRNCAETKLTFLTGAIRSGAQKASAPVRAVAKQSFERYVLTLS